MLKNSSLRILAIAFGLSLVGCADQVTPLGIDDINENQDDGTSADVLKDDVEPTGRPDDSASNVPDNVCLHCTFKTVKPTPASPAAPVEVELNPVPVR